LKKLVSITLRQTFRPDNLVSNVWNSGGYVEVDAGDLANGLESVTNLFITVGKTNQFIRLKVVAP